MEGFCVMSLGGLYLEGFIHRGAYFFNFTVLLFLILVEHPLTLKIQLFSLLYNSIYFCNFLLLMFVLVSF